MDQEHQREIVRILREAGFTLKEIAATLQVKQSVLVKYLLWVSEAASVETRAKGKAEMHKILWGYLFDHHLRNQPYYKELLGVVERMLGVENDAARSAYVQAQISLSRALVRPQLGDLSEIGIARVLFNETHESFAPQFAEKLRWGMFFTDVFLSEWRVDFQFETVMQSYVRWVAKKIHEHLMPHWPAGAIKNALQHAFRVYTSDANERQLQLQVLLLRAQGQTYKSIAEQLKTTMSVVQRSERQGRAFALSTMTEPLASMVRPLGWKNPVVTAAIVRMNEAQDLEALRRSIEDGTCDANLKEILQSTTMPVTVLEVSVRAMNVLSWWSDVVLIGDLIQRGEDELSARRNCGARTVKEIKDELAIRGLSLGMPANDPIVEWYRTWKAKQS
ncbi:MAG: hypothetical protein NT003_00965 [Candidatus Magasanikbacteria bacterium]|nr:hypothetical protein [Candidatus Magasanikbacteria bacterium]